MQYSVVNNSRNHDGELPDGPAEKFIKRAIN